MKIKSILSLMALVIAPAAIAQISTHYAQPGIGGVILEEFVKNENVKTLDLPLNKEIDKAPTTTEERLEWLNSRNAGAQIMEAYLEDLNELETMRKNALSSLTREDLEEAEMSGTSEAEMVANILVRRLQNNYVLFVTPNPDNSDQMLWEMYKICLTPEYYTAYCNTLGTNYEKPSIPMTLAGSGKYDQSTINNEYKEVTDDTDPREGYAVFRRLSKDVPDLALSGPIIRNYPYTARIPDYADIKKLNRFYVYRTESKNNELKSKVLGIAYVTKVKGDSVTMFTMEGRRGSRTRGDYAVLVNGGKSAFSITGLYGLAKNGNYPGVRIGYDMLTFLTTSGLSGYFMADIEAQFMGRGTAPYILSNGEEFSYFYVSNGNAYAANPNPIRCALGLGYGVAFNFLGRFSLMPYVRINATYTTFLSLKANDSNYLGSVSVSDGAYLPITDQYGYPSINKDNKADFFGVRGDVGARFSVNICKQISVFVGLEYNYNQGFSKKSEAGISSADYFYKKEYLGHGRSAFNFMLGVRAVTF